MKDSTSRIECLNCHKDFIKLNKNQMFCCYECNKDYSIIMKDIKKSNEIKKIKKEFNSYAWKRMNLGWLAKYYELFGKDLKCDLCQKTLDDNMKEHGTPLHVQLQKGITNHFVLKPDSWTRLCTDCYCQTKLASFGENDKY